jgi:hypothetical protein
MGLTVHFKLAAPADWDAAQAKDVVESARGVARRFHIEGRVDKVWPVAWDVKTLRRHGSRWISRPLGGGKGRFAQVEVFPSEGFMFRVDAGEDCEALWMGLCRYPRTVLCLGQEVPTGLGGGWQVEVFSKTQYASLHGWEHFARCHCAVVELLAGWRAAGVRVSISDEGDYWPHRSIRALRENLDEMNCAVAGAAGALKDIGEELCGEGSGVESPIFRHQDFERLEAAGTNGGLGAGHRRE